MPGSSVRSVAFGGAVVHDGAVRAGAGDGVEATGRAACRSPGAAPAGGRRPRSRARLPLFGVARQPAEEAGDRGAVAAMRGADAVELDGVLAGLGQRDRIGVAHDGAPAACSRSPPRCGAVAVSTSTRLPILPSVSSAAPSSSGGASVTALPSQATVRSGILRRSMKRSTWPSVCSSAKPSANGVCGTSPPRMLSSQAIESGAVSSATSAPFAATMSAMRLRRCLAGLAGELDGMRQHRRERRRRAVGPHRVDRVLLDRHEAAAGALRGAREALVAVDGMQPRIEAELAALGQIGGDPGLGRFLGDLVRHEGVGIDLAAHRQRVAAVDEDRGRVGQHDGEAGRAAEAGQPGQALRAARHVFALMLVGARHDEAVEAAPLQLGAQGGQPRRRRRQGIEPVVGPGQARPATPSGPWSVRRRARGSISSTHSGPASPSGAAATPRIRASSAEGSVTGRAGAGGGERRRGRNSW